MRVCIVTTAFPRWPDDSRGTFVFEAARAVAQQGAEVRVVTLHSPGAKTLEVMDSIEVVRARYAWPERLERLQGPGGLPVAWGQGWGARALFVLFGAALTAAVARHARHADVVHANWSLAAMAAVISRPIHRRPVVATLQGSDIFGVQQSRVLAAMSRVTLNRTEQNLVLSQALRRATIELGVEEARVRVIPNGVDLKRFVAGAEDRDPIVLYVGSLIERKGVGFLIDAMKRVVAERAGGKLWLVGAGPTEPKLRRQAADLGLQESVEFLGLQTPDKVAHLMRKSSVFVLPSLEEGLGVVLLEALASGTPCIGSDVGGIPDVISKDVGLTVGPAEPERLAESILSLLNDDVRWRALSRSARARAENDYDWRVIGARLLDVYAGVTDSPAGNASTLAARR